MAAIGKTPILLYGSTTSTNTPSAGNLTNSSDGCEIAINVADKNLFFKDSTNAVNTVPIRQSSASSNGWLSSTDWSTFNSKQPAGTYVTSVTGTAPVVSSGGTTPAISMAAASGSANGYLTSTDWTTFNNKANAFTYTTGYVTFGQGTTTPAQDANLFWDNTNKRLGTGTTSPAARLDVTGIYNGLQARFGYVAGRGLEISTAVSSGTNEAGSVLNAKGAGSGALIFQTDTVDRVTVTSTGNLSIANGNLVIGTSGKGIDFSATSDGSGTATSELLADYEEGTWTPTLASTSGTITSYTSSGVYTKIGRLVCVQFIATITNNGTGAGAIDIGALPFTSSSYSVGCGRENVNTGNMLQLYLATSATTARLYTYNNTYPGATNSSFIVSMSYITAS